MKRPPTLLDRLRKYYESEDENTKPIYAHISGGSVYRVTPTKQMISTNSNEGKQPIIDKKSRFTTSFVDMLRYIKGE